MLCETAASSSSLIFIWCALSNYRTLVILSLFSLCLWCVPVHFPPKDLYCHLDLKGSSKKILIGLFRLSHSQEPSPVPSSVPFLG